MGITASLFYNSSTEKQTLHRRITPSNEQKEAQKQRWNELADYLKAELKIISGYSIYSWLQGSYKFKTQLRPLFNGDEFDIDLGIYFQWQGEPHDGEFSPLQLKKMVQECMEAYRQHQNDIKKVASPKMRCNRIHYEGDFHIDVPTYHLDNSRDARALATEEDEWEESDPKAIYVWFKQQFPDEDIRHNVRRLIRYLKAWGILNLKEGEGKPSAILLTVLVTESYELLSEEERSSDDNALTGILRLILARLTQDSTVYNPVNHAEIMSDRLGKNGITALKKHIEQFATLAQQALNAKTEVEAADIWSTVYKHFFPLPEAREEIVKFSESRQDSLLRQVFTPTIFVTAERKKPLSQRTNNWSGIDSIGPIPKNCSITFKLVNTSSLPPYVTVEWTVRNEGAEAEIENDLGHPAGRGHSATENSAYKGVHYMDCVLRQYGRIIGVKRVKVVIN
ncbi:MULTISPECIES: CBASS cGAMP synthase [unclassified Tolypothrix]|uniref:CBASS cGAMP synthase n=1 Tax=unclassified Tolypothrix TaxID=2649714 RepID=UPI0005EAAE23|nr:MULTISPECIES: nucleotidyltransferase [unclassified Tolypothrix]BAY93697.1 hypothetical protein NIES3275_57390 [Microchaete diplosiphon NIES-3275]EKF03304.1 hypothetical protein FDUTEX481_02764 [Tolypothrix sp. PCC 7601]MBE9082569.1 nucleotidyltransferase [Tolypothrix sp. LEGE 11397]UYD27512.1 nucleotidyltransferase [Tolypothrix sp. PCC 7712]UYD36626.1 nucleotidyltransferase [Tolypothrix sp. PCC 7601]